MTPLALAPCRRLGQDTTASAQHGCCRPYTHHSDAGAVAPRRHQKTRRHSQNRKYITCYNATREGPSRARHGQRTENLVKFRGQFTQLIQKTECNKRTDRRTDRQTLSTALHSQLMRSGSVIIAPITLQYMGPAECVPPILESWTKCVWSPRISVTVIFFDELERSHFSLAAGLHPHPREASGFKEQGARTDAEKESG